VRYDADRKLWIYQHSERRIDSALWGLPDCTIAKNSSRPAIWKGSTSKHKEVSPVCITIEKQAIGENGTPLGKRNLSDV
jgi:hypothetical protein